MRKIFKLMPIYLIFLSVFLIKTDIIKAKDSDFTIKNGILTKYTGTKESVKIPNSVTKIGDYVFSECSDLSNIEIPNSVTEIGEGAFYACGNLNNIEIPNSVTKIGDSAFYGCGNLSNIEIPNSVTEIGDAAFRYCSLNNIEIPNSVTKIGVDVFYCCMNLNNIEIPNSVTEIGSSAFAYCSGLNNIEIPNGVTKIDAGAFHDCINLKNIKIPNSVTEIGGGVFYNCSNNLIIYGKKSSYAQQYANKNEIEFKEDNSWEEIKEDKIVKTPTIKSLKALGDKKLKLSFKKDKTLDGYQIVYSKNMKFKNKQTKLIDNKTTYTLSNLDTGMYAIKVRGYILDSAGKKVYSKYTKAKMINIK